jgi:hypothetical protein
VDKEISYPEYMGLMLGRKPEKVTLLQYDISSKATKVFGRLLFGKKIEGIWHTSLLCFEKEWWYGGDLFRSTPLKTPFGEPVKRVELGETYFTQQELMKHITEHLHDKFNQKTYDVFENNCNNYTNTISIFLCGKKIPQEILDMPRDLMAGGVARLLRRPLNGWLGGFGEKQKEDEETLEVVLKALGEDRKLFHWKDRTVEITEAREKEKKVDLRYFWKGEFVEVKNVATSELSKIDEMIDQDFQFIAMTAIEDADVRRGIADSIHFRSMRAREDKIISSEVFQVIFRNPDDDKIIPSSQRKTCCSPCS